MQAVPPHVMAALDAAIHAFLAERLT